ncbi:secreted RxLR effector protein 78-like [Beta vulgaris subsp. vulgaris]|uniref:secreted RxLR effector protein 78-like n=1 Tax=Beta vulgaris subsp. vulgaris TaxID=3555 RepID=UPI0020371218|nr:secreted RxLR effector protein 78-like [Beta vulgaris subsp. vulgaris]
MAKVLANKLKKILPCSIHESQSGFVPGRLITDNTLVAYECFHYLRKKEKGVKGNLALKLDMSKAYDRVEWSFLRSIMEKMGFPELFVNSIMQCVTSSSFSILVNGQPSDGFTSSQGLRQGDPLFPFLFILCAEGLSALHREAEKKNPYMT